MENLSTGVQELVPELVETRRMLHRNPELGLDLPWTSNFVKERVEAIGLRDVKTGLATSGLSALAGDGERTLLLRADMDALPIHEENDVDYKSQNDGRMHNSMAL
jgi:metal-dependent amidase/aminoacylase/carboxypeptidase family protein